MICKLLTEKVVMGLPLSILWVNTLAEWETMVQNDFPGIIGGEWEWYPLQRHNSVASRHMEIQKTPPQGHPALTSALEPIQGVTIPRVAESFKSVINEIRYATHIKLINLLHVDNANLTNQDLNTSLDMPENR